MAACSSSGEAIIHGAVINSIDLHFSRITDAECKSFRRLKLLLQDDRCFFNNNTLPQSIRLTLLDFNLNENAATRPNICAFFRQLLVHITSAIMNDNDMVINTRFVPYRFFCLVNDIIPETVEGTEWDFDHFLYDDDVSTLVLSAPPSPGEENLPDSTSNSN